MLNKAISILLIPLVLISVSGLIVFSEHCGMSKSHSCSLSVEKSCCCSKDLHNRCCHTTKFEIKKIEDPFCYSPQQVITASDVYIQTLCFKPTLPAVILLYNRSFYKISVPPEPPNSFPILYGSFLI